MAVELSSTRVSYSFSRVLLLAYLLSAKPSSAVVIPKECLDIDIFMTADLAKISLCMIMFMKQNPELAKEFQEIHHTIKALAGMVGKLDPETAGIFTVLAGSLYLAAQAFKLFYIKLPQHLENIEEYRMELRTLYLHKNVPVLRDINDILGNWQEYQIEKVTNALLATLRDIREKLTEVFRKIKFEKPKVIENKDRAVVVGTASGAVVVGSAVAAVVFPPAGVVMVVGYCTTVGVGLVTAFASYKTRSDLDVVEKELEKLQDKIYEYKEQIAIGEDKVRSILLKSYRTVRPPSNRG